MNKKLVETYLNLAKSRRRGEVCKLNFAATYSCPGKCKMCGIWKIYKTNPKSKKNELTLDEIRKFAGKNRFVWVSLTGGEPFSRKDIDKVATAFSPPMMSITTNGFDPKTIENKVDKIAGTFPLFVNVSLDGPKKIHEKIRGIPFKKSIETLERLDGLSKQHPMLSASFEFTLSRWNSNHLGVLYSHIESLGLGHMIPGSTITIMHSGGIYGTEGDVERTAIEAKALDLALSRTPRNLMGLVKRAYIKGAGLYISGRIPTTGCSAGKDTVFMDPYGNIMPCIMIPGQIANIRKTNYKLKIGKRNLARSLKDCPGCWTPCEHYQGLMFDIPALVRSVL